VVSFSGTPPHLARRGRSPGGIEPATFLLPDNSSYNPISFYVSSSKNAVQAFVFDLVSRQAFDVAIMALIIVNMMTMMAETDGQSARTQAALNKVNLLFIALFAGECLLKVFALRCYFFTVGWNVFDFVVIVLSVIGAARRAYIYCSIVFIVLCCYF